MVRIITMADAASLQVVAALIADRRTAEDTDGRIFGHGAQAQLHPGEGPRGAGVGDGLGVGRALTVVSTLQGEGQTTVDGRRCQLESAPGDSHLDDVVG